MPPILELCLLVPLKGFLVLSEPEGVKAKVPWELACKGKAESSERSPPLTQSRQCM